MITLGRLKSLLHYDPATGRWTWLIGKRAGKEAGHILHRYADDRYRRRGVCVDGVKYKASRLAWFYMTGEWPENLIDHKNVNPIDDRWDNLRPATHSQNVANTRRPRKFNKTGFKGVRLCHGRYRVSIRVDGRSFSGGYFDTPEEASEAYKRLAIRHHGEFARGEWG
jgi:hypothetical protein